MTELTDERLAELRRIAEAAESQEPWRTDDDEGRMVFAASGHQVYSALYGSNNGDAEPGDAAHIAAFDPPTAIALLDEVKRLRALTTVDDAMVERAVQALRNEGSDNPDSGWHSWRCFDWTRYPDPCTCTREAARAALEAALEAGEQA